MEMGTIVFAVLMLVLCSAGLTLEFMILTWWWQDFKGKFLNRNPNQQLNQEEPNPDRLLGRIQVSEVKIYTTEWLYGAIGTKCELLPPNSIRVVPRFLAELWLDCNFCELFESSEAGKKLKHLKKKYAVNTSHILQGVLKPSQMVLKSNLENGEIKTRHCVVEYESENVAVLVPVADLGLHSYHVLQSGSDSKWYFDLNEVNFDRAKYIDLEKIV